MGAVVLFDGVCNFCDSSVNFIIERDRDGYFKFAPLQSDAGQALADEYGFVSKVSDADGTGKHPIDSVVLIEDGRAYTHSSAALGIARRMEGPLSWMYALIVIPRPVRDCFYQLFARYRYRLFGKKDQCMMPTPELRARFL